MQITVSFNRSMTDLANSNDQVYPLSPSLSSISLSVVFKDIFQHTFPIALFPLIHFPSPLLESALTTIYHLPLTNYRSLSSGLDSRCLMPDALWFLLLLHLFPCTFWIKDKSVLPVCLSPPSWCIMLMFMFSQSHLTVSCAVSIVCTLASALASPLFLIDTKKMLNMKLRLNFFVIFFVIFYSQKWPSSVSTVRQTTFVCLSAQIKVNYQRTSIVCLCGRRSQCHWHSLV